MSWGRFLQALGVKEPPSIPKRLVTSGGRLAAQTAIGEVFVWDIESGERTHELRAEGHGLALRGDRLVLSDGREIDLATGQETPCLIGHPLFVDGERIVLGWKAWTREDAEHHEPLMELSSQLRVLVDGRRLRLIDPMRDCPGTLDLAEGTVIFPTETDGPVMDGCLHDGALVTVQRARVRMAGELAPQMHKLQVLAVTSHRGQLVSVGLGPGPELRVRGTDQMHELPELPMQPRVHSLDTGLLVRTKHGFWYRSDAGEITTLDLPGAVGVLLPLSDRVVLGRRPAAIHRLSDATCVRLLADPAVAT